MGYQTQFIQVAAGIDFDSIAPFVFVILIVASQLMGALKKKGARKEEEPDVDALERARQIREEIRRKIEERRQELEPGTTRPVNQPRRSAYDPTMPEQQQRQPQPVQQQRPAVPRTSPARPVYQVQRSRGSTLLEQLAEQRKRLESAQRQQQEARAKAKRMLQESGFEIKEREKLAGTGTASTSLLKKQLLSGLRDKNGLRKAVLYREVLGKPIGLR
jgi:hypothetical protein